MIRTLTLAAVLAAGLAPLGARSQGTDPNLGRNLAATCANCHGTNGRSVGGMPGLAGRSSGELARTLREFRDGKRPATIMHQLAKGYTDAQIDAVSAYLSAQKAN
jgi:sulfide dehydrogenase cytochrome subunit